MDRKGWANSFDTDTQQDSQSKSESRQTILKPMPQSSQLPTTSMDRYSKPEPKPTSAENRFDKHDDKTGTTQKWDLKDWKGDIFESDGQNSSLIIIMKMANHFSQLKKFLELYQEFDVHIGCKHKFLPRSSLMHFVLR